MTPKEALDILIAALNRGAFSTIELAGINASVAVIREALEPKPQAQDEKK